MFLNYFIWCILREENKKHQNHLWHLSNSLQIFLITLFTKWRKKNSTVKVFEDHLVPSLVMFRKEYHNYLHHHHQFPFPCRCPRLLHQKSLVLKRSKKKLSCWVDQKLKWLDVLPVTWFVYFQQASSGG